MMTTNTPKCDRTSLSAAASRIAGAIWDDYARLEPGTPAERLRIAASWRNFGTDGDLTADDRDALRTLASSAEMAGL